MAALEKTVIYKAATPWFLDFTIDPQRYSGLSTYIPLAPSDPELDAFYAKFDWNRDTGMILQD